MQHPLLYSTIATLQSALLLRQYEIPVTHAVSLPLPTMRGQLPGYLSFAAPAFRSPGKPQIQDAPDRWWIYSANDGRLLVYSLCAAIPLAESVTFDRQELPSPVHRLEELKALQESTTSLLEMLSPQFFEHQSGDTALRKRLYEVLIAFIPAPLLPLYSAAVPDFFAWLEV